MPFIPVAGTVMAEMIMTYDGQVVENVHHFTYAGAFGTSEMLDLAGWLKSHWDANMKAQVPNTLFLSKVKITDLQTQTGPVVEYTTGLPLQGTNAGSAMPNHVTVVVKWGTGQRGRSYRGRTYHIGLTETHVSNNVVSGAWKTSVATYYTGLMAPVSTGNPTLSVVSRYTNNAPRVAGVITDVTHYSINDVVDSQRRRLPERGQ